MPVEEDYFKIWREFYCAALHHNAPTGILNSPDRQNRLEVIAAIAHESLEVYIKNKNKIKEYSLLAFK